MLGRISNLAGPISTGGKARVAYRYYRFRTTAIRGGISPTMIQLSEIEFYFSGTKLSLAGATATNPGGSNPVGEEPSKAIDGSTATKWLDFNILPLVIDFGAGNLRVADSFRFATANDESGRDPLQWAVEGSNDNSTWTALHTQSTNATVPTARLTFTERFYFQV
jgi:hypothetical protein